MRAGRPRHGGGGGRGFVSLASGGANGLRSGRSTMNDSLRIPRLQAPVSLDWNDIRRALAPGLCQSLGQPWLEQREPRFSPGTVRLGLHGSDLLLVAELTDREPANRATEWNERTWMLGDVLELFLQSESPQREDYYEFHVTPENQRLQLHFPDGEATRRVSRGLVPLSTFHVGTPLFESRVRIAPGREGWEVFVRIGLEPLFGGLPERLRFLVSRYDYQAGAAKPVLSCNESSRLPRPDFHYRAGWSVALL